MKFTKENFQKEYKPKFKEGAKEGEEIEEDVIGGGGDKVITPNEISTDTQVSTSVDKSGREKGMSKTMDKHISQTRNPSATFGYGGEMGVAFGGRQGNMHVNGGGMNLDVDDEDRFKGDDEEVDGKGHKGNMRGTGGGSKFLNASEKDKLKESSKDKMRKLVKELMRTRNNPNEIIDKSELLSKTSEITIKSKITELVKSLKGKTVEEVQTILDLIMDEWGEANNNNNNDKPTFS